jgi:hypothetical protein
MMHILLMRSFKKRRGFASILGVLIFVSILFTSIIPMQLTMQQADNMKEQIIHEVEILDSQREMESLSVYPIPSLDADSFILTFCEISINVNRLLVNGTDYELDVFVPAMDSIEIGPFDLVPHNGGRYDIRVTTSRGNVFTSSIGVLFYIDGDWVSEILGIRIILPSRPGRGARGNDWLNELMVTLKEDNDVIYANSTMYWAISASEKFFELDSDGDYEVLVYTLARTYPYRRYWKKVYDGIHRLNWPIGDPIIELHFEIDGDQLIIE